MHTEVYELLEAKINEVFLEMQEKYNIKDGGISPMDTIELDNLTDLMTDLIVQVLKKEMEM